MKTFAINKVVRITLPSEMIRFGSKSGNNRFYVVVLLCKEESTYWKI